MSLGRWNVLDLQFTTCLRALKLTKCSWSYNTKRQHPWPQRFYIQITALLRRLPSSFRTPCTGVAISRLFKRQYSIQGRFMTRFTVEPAMQGRFMETRFTKVCVGLDSQKRRFTRFKCRSSVENFHGVDSRESIHGKVLSQVVQVDSRWQSQANLSCSH